ncbi:START domain-containing proteins involved in steroidogenesis/phosphatidylcholine transfer [Handroanthus impetiginosus]|uniref:START domain-containing proteins involved in steroidogenesis/phosphatidylcholine transfer n=1 Tax=Handroanthus impetiginosus TaxID=429701 RepID=A0A2G9I355_9LAMI|nr:START domain-containing proteins involved in steroidogenesis/phosphatidylcholine transfer [Handroanthus impetiginosus]
MALVSVFLEILRRPTIGDVVFDLMVFMVPIWAAVLVGIVVGWAWKPKWVNLNGDFLDSTANKGEKNKSIMVFPQFAASMPSLSSLKWQVPTCISWISDFGLEKEQSSLPSVSCADYSSSKMETEKSSLVNDDDLKHLHNLVEEKDGGPAWIHMMDRSTTNMSYQAWRRDPETGPPQYRSRTVYEDATPEMLRDFFWDDGFRLKWDDMLAHAETLEECPTTGTMVVQWVRKFPFFCSDREYIIGRRIWESGQTYYCITKGVPCSSVPRRNKPRRVDLYYSCWFIRPAESKRDGRLTACEVLLFHHEDMGIPWELAKLGFRQGMWGAVKKIDPGLRAYQNHRSSGAPLSRSALMAQVNTKFSVDSLESLERTNSTSESEHQVSMDKPSGRGVPKFLLVGGAIALACSLDRGLLTKAVIFGVARRLAKMGKRL